MVIDEEAGETPCAILLQRKIVNSNYYRPLIIDSDNLSTKRPFIDDCGKVRFSGAIEAEKQLMWI